MYAMNVPGEILPSTIGEIPSAYLDDIARTLFHNICGDVLKRKRMSEQERNFFQDEADTFLRNFEKILASNDRPQKETALRAVASALALSYYHGGSPRILREAKKEFDYEQGAPARTARIRPDINEIIERHALALWNRSPKFKGKHNSTANAIYYDVYAEIGRLPNLPKSWIIQNDGDAKEMERAIGRISKRLARMM
jgi:hypothetical protein